MTLCAGDHEQERCNVYIAFSLGLVVQGWSRLLQDSFRLRAALPCAFTSLAFGSGYVRGALVEIAVERLAIQWH